MLCSLALLTALPVLARPQTPATDSFATLPCATHLVDAPQLVCPAVDPNCDPNFDPTDPRFSCGLFATVFEPQHEAPGLDPGAPVYEVQLVFHLIERSDGSGRVSDFQVRDQVRVLNEDFRALQATPGRRGVDVGIQFVLARLDPEGRPTSGITRSVNNRWFRDLDQHDYCKELAWDVTRYVNVYVNEPPGFSGYVPWYPQQYIFRTFVSDRVVVRHTTVGRPGRILTHEMGHYLGLRHVFEFGCFELQNPWQICQTTGDMICDTPPTTPSSGCPTDKLACDGSPAPFRNYMDYSGEGCMGEFTPQQANRMRCTLTTWRPAIGRALEPAPMPAEAEVRNAGDNPYALWASEPWLGETTELFVRNRRHAFVTLLASPQRTERALWLGTLLIEPVDGQFRLLGHGPGNVLSVPVRVPASPSLVGRRLSVQAVLHGDQPAQLTNAVDLRVGVRGVR